MAAMSSLLHLVVASLADPLDRSAFERAVEFARSLCQAPGVRQQSIGWSDHQLVVATMLGASDDLDQFVASEQHMRFVMHGLAPIISGMWSTAIEAGNATTAPDAARLWAFALPEREGVYEWQVRQFLDDAASLGDGAIVGVTIEERERFRAGGLVSFNAATEDVAERTAAARRRWAALGGELEDALVDAHRP